MYVDILMYMYIYIPTRLLLLLIRMSLILCVYTSQIVYIYYSDKELNTPSRYQNIKLSMISKAGEFPELKGRAAEIRHLGKPLLAVWNKHFHAGNREHRLVRLALQASVGIEDVLDVAQGDFVLGDAAGNALLEHCFNLMALITSLGNFYHPRHIKLFHYTIKCHYILHLGLMAKELNPRLGWCYAGEDWMQKSQGSSGILPERHQAPGSS